MPVTAQEVFNLCMDFADERDSTNIINPTNTQDYLVRTPGILTALQNELIKAGDMYKTFEISNKPSTNMIGYSSGFDILEYQGVELIKEAQGIVKAYYFEVDGPATVYVEDYNGSWNTLATITVPDTVTSFTPYKGVVVPTSGATKSRLRFTGDYRYLITNYAMFAIPFKPDRVPDYRPWVKKQMPDDFKSVDQIIKEVAQRQYVKDNFYKFEGRRDLYINYYEEGNLRIIYRPIPAPIINMTDTLSVDDVTARTLLPYGLGMELFKGEDEDMYKHFKSRYQELKAFTIVPQPVSEELIADVYGWGD